MRVRSEKRFDYDDGSVPRYELQIIKTFFEERIERSAKLFWEVLKLIRRPEISDEQIRQFENLPDSQRARMWKLGYKWLTPIEFSHVKTTLDGLQNEVKTLQVRVPWGKVRAVQELSRWALRDII